jgi:hypothetical protein
MIDAILSLWVLLLLLSFVFFVFFSVAVVALGAARRRRFGIALVCLLAPS